MNRISKQSEQWFIQIENKDNHQRLTVYDDGLVYGTERGQIIAKLTSDTVDKLKGILNGKLDERGNQFNERTISNRTNYIHFFKVKIYNKYYHNNLILRIRDNSRKHRPIKVVGWYVTSNLLSIIKNPKNWI
jgi:hypothetical protein